MAETSSPRHGGFSKFLSDKFFNTTPFGIGAEPPTFNEYDSRQRRIIEEWKAEMQLGKGGFGSVFLCTGKNSRQSVALKAVKVTSLQEAQDVARTEVAGLMSLDHPSIVKVKTGFIPHKNMAPQPQPLPIICISMEPVPGKNLQELIESRDLYPLIPVKEKLRWVCQLVDAMEYLSKRKVVHNDLKPANIMISFDEGVSHLKIVDFGLARYDPSAPPPPGGTLPWLPPEHPFFSGVNGLNLTPRQYRPSSMGDIWAMGIIIFQIFASDNNWLREHQSMAMVLLHPMKSMKQLLEDKISYLAIRILLAGLLTPLAERYEITKIKEMIQFPYSVIMNKDFDVESYCKTSSKTSMLEISSTQILLECGDEGTEKALEFLSYWSRIPDTHDIIARHVLPNLLKLIPQTYSLSTSGSEGLIELLKKSLADSDSSMTDTEQFMRLLSQVGHSGIMDHIFKTIYQLLQHSISWQISVSIINSGKLFPIITQHMHHSSHAHLVVEQLTDEFPCLYYLDRTAGLMDRLICELGQDPPHAAVGFLSRKSFFFTTPLSLFLTATQESTRYKSIVLRDVLQSHRDSGVLVPSDPLTKADFLSFLKVCFEENHNCKQQAQQFLFSLITSPLSEDALVKYCLWNQLCTREYSSLPIFQPILRCRTCSEKTKAAVRICFACRNTCHSGHTVVGPIIWDRRICCLCELGVEKCGASASMSRPLACPEDLSMISPFTLGLSQALSPPYFTKNQKPFPPVDMSRTFFPRPYDFTWNGSFNPRTGKICFPSTVWSVFPVVGIQIPQSSQNPPQILFYCEVTIDTLPPNEPTSTYLSLTMGFSPSVPKNPAAIGWEPGQLGFHSDDGFLYFSSGSKPHLQFFGPKFGEKDVVGVGLLTTGQPFFTWNGMYLPLNVPEVFASLNRQTYFCLSSACPATCTIRFTPDSFCFRPSRIHSAQLWPFPVNRDAISLIAEVFPEGIPLLMELQNAGSAPSMDLSKINDLWRLVASILRLQGFQLPSTFHTSFTDDELHHSDPEIVTKWADLQDIPLAALTFSDHFSPNPEDYYIHAHSTLYPPLPSVVNPLMSIPAGPSSSASKYLNALLQPRLSLIIGIPVSIDSSDGQFIIDCSQFSVPDWRSCPNPFCFRYSHTTSFAASHEFLSSASQYGTCSHAVATTTSTKPAGARNTRHICESDRIYRDTNCALLANSTAAATSSVAAISKIIFKWAIK